MIQQHHLGTQGRALGCNDGITKTRADVHGMFPREGDAGINYGFYLSVGYNIGFTSGPIMIRPKRANLVVWLTFTLENCNFATP